MQQHSVVQALQAGGAPSRDPIEEANQVGEHPPPKRKKSLKPKVTFGSKVTIVPAMDQALQVHASSEVAQEIPGDPTPELRLIVTSGAVVWHVSLHDSYGSTAHTRLHIPSPHVQ